MKEIIFAFLLLICNKYCFGNKIDSLLNDYNKSVNDTNSIKTLIKIGDYYEYNKPDSSLFYYNKALNNINEILKTDKNKSFQKLQSKIIFYIALILKNKGEYDNAIMQMNNAMDIGILANDKVREALCLTEIGVINSFKGNFEISLDFYDKSLKVYKQINNQKGISHCYTNIGLIYTEKGNYDKSIESFLKALKIAEIANDENVMSDCYNNIGIVYSHLKEYDKTIEYFTKTLKIKELKNDVYGMAVLNINIGSVLLEQLKLDEALSFFKNALLSSEKLENPTIISHCFNNLGLIYKEKEDYKLALDYYLKALKIKKNLDDKNGIAAIIGNISFLYYRNAIKNNSSITERIRYLDSAIVFSNEALAIANEIGSLKLKNSSANTLALIYKSKGDYKKVSEYYELFISTNDSIFSEEKTKSLSDMTVKYETEKKQLQIENLEKDNKLKLEENNKQKIIIYSFILGFLIILFFSILLYRMFVQKKKANILLAQKNIEVEQKNEEITSQRDEISAQRDLVTQQKNEIVYIHEELTDSINYAKRIQEAVLPISTESRLIMGEHFILFRPKDIVSGDFYWTAKIDNTLIVAVADCTGHGVPGAFMSMLGISFLNEIIRKKEIIAANQVLNELRKEIINALQQKGQLGEQKDGMDISLIAISQLSKSSELYQAQWAGANNPLWLVRSSKNLQGFENLGGLSDENCQVKTHDRGSVGLGEDASANYEQQTTNNELFEFKPDKMPIAIYEKMDNFTNHELQLNSGDILYLMSDGYEDQFGGPKGKKFLSKNLKELIISNCLLTMEEQKQVLEKTLVEWIGEGEQIDDITILGIKI